MATKFKKRVSNNPSGRPRGSKNRRTILLEEKLKFLGCDPIENIVNLLNDEKTDDGIKAKLNCVLAGYLYPKRKAVEITGAEGAPIQNKFIVEFVDAPKRETQ